MALEQSCVCAVGQVSGIGKYPFLALQRSNLQFGQVLVGEQVEQTVQLLNQGLVPADFSVKPVPASDSLTDETIKLTPSRSGAFAHSLEISKDNDSFVLFCSDTVLLSKCQRTLAYMLCMGHPKAI